MTQQRKFQVGDCVIVNGHREEGNGHNFGTNNIIRQWERDATVLKVKGATTSKRKFRCGDGEETFCFAPSEISLADDHQAQANTDTHDVAGFIRQAYERGETLQTRYGDKAQIFMLAPKQLKPVLGVVYSPDGEWLPRRWYADGSDLDDDISLMTPTRTINGFEVPRPPERAPEYGINIYIADPCSEIWRKSGVWQDMCVDHHWFRCGLVFRDEASAIATAKAMVGVDPET